MDLVGKRLLISRDISFSQFTMGFDRLFETIILTNKHDRSLVSPMTRIDSVHFVPLAMMSQLCKERCASRAECELITNFGRYDTRSALFIGKADMESPSS